MTNNDVNIELEKALAENSVLEEEHEKEFSAYYAKSEKLKARIKELKIQHLKESKLLSKVIFEYASDNRSYHLDFKVSYTDTSSAIEKEIYTLFDLYPHGGIELGEGFRIWCDDGEIYITFEKSLSPAEIQRIIEEYSLVISMDNLSRLIAETENELATYRMMKLVFEKKGGE